jgi:small subunit ribosomal protein S10
MRAAYYLGLPAKGPVPLPQITERWTVPRSPFIHKKSQENFERKTLRRLIQIQDGHPEVVQAWLAYLEKRVYYGIGMKANTYEFEDFDVLKSMDENVKLFEKEAEETGAFENYGTQGQKTLKNLEKNVDDILIEDLILPGHEPSRRYPVEIARQRK